MPNINTVIAQARRRLLQMHYESKVGHIGGNLSCLDTLLVLHHQVMSAEDVFVLSKGHAAGALYVTLWSLGVLEDADLRQFHKDATKLSGHPAPNHLPHIPFATGSLGHGLSLSAGIALGRRLQQLPGRVYCLLSDGEWQEGSNWEALIFAAHHDLPLTFVVDTNGLQGFGSTRDIASQDSLAERFRAFNVPVVEIDGHDAAALARELSQSPPGLKAIIALTRKGCGIEFMENRMEWHYLPLTEEQYAQALRHTDHTEQGEAGEDA